MYSPQDAINRVIAARKKALDPKQINLEYLRTLKHHLQIWVDNISDEMIKIEAIRNGHRL